MSVFVWATQSVDPDTLTKDEFRTAWAMNAPQCIFCGESIRNGQKIWHWHAERDAHAHAACMKRHGPGILKDIAECMK